MNKRQLKLNNFALAGALERYKDCYEQELESRKIWRKDCQEAQRAVAELEGVVDNQALKIEALHKRIYFLENRGQAEQAPEYVGDLNEG